MLLQVCAINDPIYMLEELENLWRERVNAAEKQYHRARAEADAALKLCDCDATSAQIEAFIQTRSREAAALDEFMRVLKIFHDLVVAGKET
jgi:ElaB/YqjD/DUF883 family membrane-anchored ribosome-binding protein